MNQPIHHKTLQRYQSSSVSTFTQEEANLALATINAMVSDTEKTLSKLKSRARDLERRIGELVRQAQEREEHEAFEKIRLEAKAQGLSITDFIASLEARANKMRGVGATADAVAPHFRDGTSNG